MSDSVLDALGRVIGTCPACDGAGEIDDGSDWGRKGCDRCFLLRELREALADPALTMVCDHSSLSDPVFVHSSSDDLCGCSGCRLAVLLSGAPSRETP